MGNISFHIFFFMKKTDPKKPRTTDTYRKSGSDPLSTFSGRTKALSRSGNLIPAGATHHPKTGKRLKGAPNSVPKPNAPNSKATTPAKKSGGRYSGNQNPKK